RPKARWLPPRPPWPRLRRPPRPPTRPNAFDRPSRRSPKGVAIGGPLFFCGQHFGADIRRGVYRAAMSPPETEPSPDDADAGSPAATLAGPRAEPLSGLSWSEDGAPRSVRFDDVYFSRDDG